jgi:hypothetical protein
MDLTLLKSIASHEIAEVIAKASLFGGKIAQPTLTSNLVTPIKRIDLGPKGLTIKLYEDAFLISDKPISINLNYRSLHFHIDPKKCSIQGNTIVTSLPTEVRALEIRDNERYVLPFPSQVATSIYRIEKRAATFNGDCQLIDVSRNGLGLIITGCEEQTLLKHDHIWLKSINGQQLPQPIFGRVVYVNPRKYKDDAMDLKIGVSLEVEIPEEIFDELKQMCKLVLKA